MLISAVIITKNEEKNIERCIKSLLNIVDEIVVLDALSSDKTKEICLGYGTKFESKEWTGYAEQKNYANSLASYDTILSIDADEELSEELQKSILQIKTNEADNSVYQFNRFNNYCGKWIKHGAWYPDKKVRIFNRKTTSWEDTKVHERLNFGDSKIIFLKGNLLHYSYNTVDEHIARTCKYANLYAQYAFEQGKRKTFFAFLMNTLWKFFADYIFRGGFLDGIYGFSIYKITVLDRYLRYLKLRELRKTKIQ